MRKAEDNQERLKLSGTHNCTLYTNGINKLVENRNTAQKNTNALPVMSKEVRLEANVNRTGILQDRNTARS